MAKALESDSPFNKDDNLGISLACRWVKYFVWQSFHSYVWSLNPAQTESVWLRNIFAPNYFTLISGVVKHISIVPYFSLL